MNHSPENSSPKETYAHFDWVAQNLKGYIDNDYSPEKHKDIKYTPGYAMYRVDDYKGYIHESAVAPQFLIVYMKTDPQFFNDFNSICVNEFDGINALTFLKCGFTEVNGLPFFVMTKAEKFQGFTKYAFQAISLLSLYKEADYSINQDLLNFFLEDLIYKKELSKDKNRNIYTTDQDKRSIGADTILEDIKYKYLGLKKFNPEFNCEIQQGDNSEATQIYGQRIEFIAGRLRIVDATGMPVISLISGKEAIKQFELLELRLGEAMKTGKSAMVANAYEFHGDGIAVSDTGAELSKSSTRKDENMENLIGKKKVYPTIYHPNPDGTITIHLLPPQITTDFVNEDPILIDNEDLEKFLDDPATALEFLSLIDEPFNSEIVSSHEPGQNFNEISISTKNGNSLVNFANSSSYPKNNKPSPLPFNPDVLYINTPSKSSSFNELLNDISTTQTNSSTSSYTKGSNETVEQNLQTIHIKKINRNEEAHTSSERSDKKVTRENVEETKSSTSTRERSKTDNSKLIHISSPRIKTESVTNALGLNESQLNNSNKVSNEGVVGKVTVRNHYAWDNRQEKLREPSYITALMGSSHKKKSISHTLTGINTINTSKTNAPIKSKKRIKNNAKLSLKAEAELPDEISAENLLTITSDKLNRLMAYGS